MRLLHLPARPPHGMLDSTDASVNICRTGASGSGDEEASATDLQPVVCTARMAMEPQPQPISSTLSSGPTSAIASIASSFASCASFRLPPGAEADCASHDEPQQAQHSAAQRD